MSHDDQWKARLRLGSRLLILVVLLAVWLWTGAVVAAAELSNDEGDGEAVAESSEQAPEPGRRLLKPMPNTPDSKRELQEHAAGFGKDPTAITGYYEFHYEHDQFLAGARTENAVAIASLALTPSLLMKVTLPYVWSVPNQPDASNENGAGDMQVRVGARVYHTPHLALFIGTDLLLPTASPEALGSGKYTLGPGIAAAAPIPMLRSLFSVIVQKFNSIGGDSEQPDIDYAQFQASLTTIWSEQLYSTLQPFLNVDWNRHGKTGMNMEAEIGYQFDGQLQAFLHPGVGLWGKDIAGGYDWIVQCGVRWMIPGSIFSRALFEGFSGG